MKRLLLGFTLALINVSVFSQTSQAYVAPGELRTFLDYNLGADTSLNSTVPAQGIKGAKYQWGKNTPVNSASWGSTSAIDSSWSDSGKTLNDPCPDGYRVPTSAEWQGVIDNNSVQWVGDFVEDGTNMYTRHGSGILINNSLFLPAAGSNYYVNGNLFSNNASGAYWSTTVTGWANYAKGLTFMKALLSNNQTLNVGFSIDKNSGANVRCIKEPVSFPNGILYPNPVKDNFFVNDDALKKMIRVKVYNTAGKLVLQKDIVTPSKESISTKDLVSGIYSVKITKEGKTYTEKIKVQN
ncbi:T9SS type A sorting domain-containing protein [Chryseobacterium lathyri]|uniref:Secretion system C-terminal sorting domain-containing protein n=1 Tax=Chryseobacterium lathyri TaxID=395933 RepID=A0A511YFW4_9FLAO|nr:T9SS type A sorting domain-containing protein [Chryseobacterium lathyri]GEN74071.1 hypothetical protein CLA01_41430 [Chryseobacterium lathyri]